MNNLDLRKFRADVPAADPAHMAATRRRLLEAAWAEGSGSPRQRRWLTRFALPGMAIPVAVAVALIAASTLSGTTDHTREHRAVTAGQFLNRAATWVEQQPTVAMRDGDWLYQKELTPVFRSQAGEPGGTLSTTVQESWWSVDGSKARLDGPDVPPGMSGVRSAGLEGDDKSPLQYQDEIASWPNDADALLDRVSGGRMDHQDGQDRAFTKLAVVLRDVPIIPSSLLATIYRALAKIPGVTIEDTRDPAGRSGVAVDRAEPATTGPDGDSMKLRSDIILDPDTYAYLGERTTAVGPVPADIAHDGQTLHESARLASGVVGGPYDRP
jgi:hypothetical protein